MTSARGEAVPDHPISPHAMANSNQTGVQTRLNASRAQRAPQPEVARVKDLRGIVVHGIRMAAPRRSAPRLSTGC